MARKGSDIERLIELGLNRYGAGDLDAALLLWEEALAIDPDNKQASSYVDYVRLHYELIRTDGDPEIVTGDEEPFGIAEEPDYQIEISDGELSPRAEPQPVVADDVVDAGWFDEEATHDAARELTTQSDAFGNIFTPAPLPDPEPLLELEADEPPPRPPPDVSFEDATREYHGAPAKPASAPSQQAAPVSAADATDSGSTSEFGTEYTGGFTNEGSSLGFSHLETEIRKRDLGFVHPTAAPLPVSDSGSSPLTIGSAPALDIGSLEKTQERTPFKPPDEDELIASLPTPRPARSAPETQDVPVLGGKVNTRELPEKTRPPATARHDSTELSQAEVMLRNAPTQDFNSGGRSESAPLHAGPARIDITAPTRELGIRPPATSPLTNPTDEDAPTKQSDVRAIRSATARDDGRASSRPGSELTNSDIVLPFDPIAARSAQILEDVDTEAPATESREDQTRRRIAALLERAVAWNDAGDTDRAVAAVDLALAEDPNSALGQKLITRNRETILHVFQSFLGDLERMPQLARPLHELQNAPISPRAAFLLSRIDGTLTLDELLDVSGMPKLEAYRHLCQLFLRGILR